MPKVIDENWVAWGEKQYPRCKGVNVRGKQCGRQALKNKGLCQFHDSAEQNALVSQKSTTLVKKIETLKADPDLRSFDSHLATLKALSDDIRDRMEDIGITDDDRMKLANFIELSTRLLEREARIKSAQKNSVTYEELGEIIKRIAFTINSHCPSCPTRAKLATALAKIEVTDG